MEKILKIKNISKSFGGIQAVKECSFDIRKGEVIGLIGPNGAGKTTLFDILSGFVRADEGQALFYLSDNKKINILNLSPYKIANLGISRTFQNVRLFENLSIKDHIHIAIDNEDTKFWKNIIYKDKLYIWSDKKIEEYIREYGIDKSADTIVSDLSYGQKKLLQIALAMLKKHSLILFDEPVAGVNTLVKRKIEDIILNLKQKGETMIIIEHDIQFIKNLSDKIIVMDEGKILKKGLPNEVLESKEVIEAYLGD